MRRVLVVLVVVAAGCVRQPQRPAFPEPPQPVTIVARNHTGDGLVVEGASILERAFHAPRITVTDVLADQAENVLRARGVRVRTASTRDGSTPETAASPAPTRDGADGVERADAAPAAAVTGASLYLDVRRWEADASTHPAFVIVGVDASLVDAQSGRELWSAHPPIHPIATPGTILVGDAYAIAARKVVDELLAQPPIKR